MSNQNHLDANNIKKLKIPRNHVYAVLWLEIRVNRPSGELDGRTQPSIKFSNLAS